MKLRIFCVIAAIICLLSFNVSAEESRIFEMDVPEEYSVLYAGEDAESMATKLNMKTSELESYMGENGLLMIALSKDRAYQIKISEEETEFSQLTQDISVLDKEALNEFSQTITSKNNSPFEYVTNSGRQYVKFSETLKDSGGDYTATQYVTVCEGKIYRFCFYNSGLQESEQADEMFSRFKLLGFEAKKLPEWVGIALIFGIAIFASVSVAMVFGIIKQRKISKERAAQETEEVQQEESEEASDNEQPQEETP